MNNRKSYNSILFLTVYLGLVLVGASPQVLAHAATNSLFDLRNEIEYKDDLDKKPDNDEVNDFLALEPEKAIGEFINELKKIKKSWRGISNRYIEQECGHYWSRNEAGAAIGPIVRRRFEPNTTSSLFKLWQKYEKFLTGFSEENIPSFYKPIRENEVVHFSQKHSFQKRSLNIQLNFTHGSAEQAESFVENLNESFAKKALQTNDSVTKVVYENTKAISSDGYVSVITNLPRASIDSLLK